MVKSRIRRLLHAAADALSTHGARGVGIQGRSAVPPFSALVGKSMKRRGNVVCAKCIQIRVYNRYTVYSIYKSCTSDIKLYLGIDQWSCI